MKILLTPTVAWSTLNGEYVGWIAYDIDYYIMAQGKTIYEAIDNIILTREIDEENVLALPKNMQPQLPSIVEKFKTCENMFVGYGSRKYPDHIIKIGEE